MAKGPRLVTLSAGPDTQVRRWALYSRCCRRELKPLKGSHGLIARGSVAKLLIRQNKGRQRRRSRPRSCNFPAPRMMHEDECQTSSAASTVLQGS